MNTYILVSNKKFHTAIFNKLKEDTTANWEFIDSSAALTYDSLKKSSPTYIFFLHWSEKIKEEVYLNFNSIVFHMTDLPYGRGGSPLQNLIVRGHTKTKLSAIKVVATIDSGAVYLKKDLSLSGAAKQIFERTAALMYDMIREIIETNPVPVEQTGVVEVFKRRKPEESNLKEINDIPSVYNHIRMLDADGYPHAFLENEHLKFEFTEAQLNPDNSVTAHVRIIKK